MAKEPGFDEATAEFQYQCLILEEKAELAREVTRSLLVTVPDEGRSAPLRDALSLAAVSLDHKQLADRVAEYVNAMFEGIVGS